MSWWMTLAHAAPIPVAPVATLATVPAASDVVAADVDFDGDLDLVAASRTAGTTLLTRSGGAYTGAVIGPAAYDVHVADLDRDGDLDVAYAGGTGAGWLERAGTAWIDHPTLSGLGDLQALGVGDVDGDGALDLLAGGSGTGIGLARGPAFAAESLSTTHADVWGLAVADADLDGSPEVIATTSGGVVWFDGGVPTALASPPAGPRAVVVAPFASGRPEVVVAGFSGARDVKAWAGAGAAPTTIVTGHQTNTLFPADVDADGDLDLVSSRVDADGFAWLDNGRGTWTERMVDPAFDRAWRTLAADLDADGDLDLVAADINLPGAVVWWRNDRLHRGARFSTSVQGPAAADVLLADVDLDGTLDVVAAETDVVAYLPAREVIATGQATALAWRDGVLAVASPAGIATYRRDGAWSGGALAALADPTDVALVDVDRDGRLDVVASSGAGVVWIDPTGASTSITTRTTLGIDTGDIDRDGRVDVATAGSNIVGWFENPGPGGGAWPSRPIDTAFVQARAIRIVDLDVDGDMDVVAAGAFVDWCENLGFGFAPHRLSSATGGAAALEVLDLDHDGVYEVAAANPAGRVVVFDRVLTSATEQTVATLALPAGLASGDVDRDGDADLVAVGGARVAVTTRLAGASIAVAGLAPTLSANGVVAAARVVVEHLGQTGDRAVALRRLPVTVEPGGALAEVRLYREADGTGAFSAGDALIASAVPAADLVPAGATVAAEQAQTFHVVVVGADDVDIGVDAVTVTPEADAAILEDVGGFPLAWFTEPGSGTVGLDVPPPPGVDLDPAVAGVDAAAAYVEGEAGVAIAPSAVVDGTVERVALAFEAAPGDVWTATGGDGVTVTSTDDGLVLSGPAERSAFDAALRSVRFASTSEAPEGEREVGVTVEGAGRTASAVARVAVTGVNDPPVAGDAAYAGVEDVALSVAAPGVLAGASDVDGDVLTAAVEDGTAIVQADGAFTYTPAPDASGVDTFTVRVSDGTASVVVTVTVDVAAVNDPPVAVGEAFETLGGLAVAAPGVLANDTDVEGGLVAVVVTPPAHGTLVLAEDGGFTWDPGDFTGADGFRYAASDGEATAEADVALVARAVVVDDTGDSGGADSDAPEGGPPGCGGCGGGGMPGWLPLLLAMAAGRRR